MNYYEWPSYVTVAERRAKAAKALEKLKKKGLKVQPVDLAGRRIAGSFWGKGWCDHMESFSDYANRLPRGRSYVRNGSVCHLEIQSGLIKAIVSGSQLYNVAITVSALTKKRWDGLRSACIGRIGSLIDLLRGKLDRAVMEIVSDRQEGLFPLPGEMKFACDCPDLAGMCKHVAAALYGVGARLDHAPELLFLLRGVDHAELVDVSAAVAEVAKAGTSRRRIAATGVAGVFGIDLVETDEAVSAEASPAPVKAEVPSSRAVSTDKNQSGKDQGNPKIGQGGFLPRTSHRRRHLRLAVIPRGDSGDLRGPHRHNRRQHFAMGEKRPAHHRRAAAHVVGIA